jgi:hypothetical protein
MAKPTAVAEVGGAKVLLLADSTAVTPVSKMPAAVQSGVSGEATWPVGWLGVATHRDTDAHNLAGGFTGASLAPVALQGIKDYAATPLVRAARGDENGNAYMAGYGHAAAGLKLVDATAGGTSITNTVTETAISVVDASRFGYLCMIHAVCSVVGTNAAIATWTLKDGAAGTTIWVFDVPINSPTGTTLNGFTAGGGPITFAVPLKTNAINKAFTMTASVATLGTWRFHVNGYLSTM